MLRTLTLTFFLFFCSLIFIYPSKKENTNLLDYCYSLEKIISRNILEKSNNFSTKYNSLAKDFTLFGAKKAKGALVNKIITQYKNSKKFYFINFVPNQFFCLAGYWIEDFNPRIFQSIFYEKSKQKLNQHSDIRNEVDEFIKDINSEYKSIKKEINEFF